MPLNCPLCSRAEPGRGRCIAATTARRLGDGAPRAARSRSGHSRFPVRSFSPPAAFCRNFDELVLACEEHWEEARDLLREGLLEGFLSGLGRPDLAFAARRGAAERGPRTSASTNCWPSCPAGCACRPGWRCSRRKSTSAGSRSGADHRFVVRILNEGMGLIRGSASCGRPRLAGAGRGRRGAGQGLSVPPRPGPDGAAWSASGCGPASGRRRPAVKSNPTAARPWSWCALRRRPSCRLPTACWPGPSRRGGWPR